MTDAKSAPVKFTVKKIESFRPEERQYEVSELNGHGFRLRISPKGHKTFIYRYRFGTKSRILVYGAYPFLSLADAHQMHAETVAQVKNKIDPAALKQNRFHGEKNAILVSQLVNEYIKYYAKKNKKTWADDLRYLEKDVLPCWGDRKVKEITHRDALLLLDEVEKRGRPTRQRLSSIIKMMFETAVERGFIENTPIKKLPSTASKPRKRILSDDEIKIVWHESMNIGAMPGARYGLRLLLLTLQRRGEFNKALWSHVDFDKRVWQIPWENSKNDIGNDVYLCELAIKQFKELKEFSNGSAYVMESMNARRLKKYNANSFSNIPQNYNHFGLPHWTLHDLRRTGCSKMLDLGAVPYVVEIILNHKQKVLIDTYHQYNYHKERKKAFELWGEWLENLIKE